MDIKVKLYLVDDQGEKFMGIGVLWLLEKIQQGSSLRKAASELEISYSKAYNMVRNLERNLGYPVVQRRRGGASHDGVSLTPLGQSLIELYRTFQQEVKEQAHQPFVQFSQKLQGLLDAQKQ